MIYPLYNRIICLYIINKMYPMYPNGKWNVEFIELIEEINWENQEKIG